MKNQVIKCTTEEQGKLIIDYWKSKGIYTGDRQGKIIDYYYGVINGKFNCYSASYCLDNKCELIELPVPLSSPKHEFKRGAKVFVGTKNEPNALELAIFAEYIEGASNPYAVFMANTKESVVTL